MAYSTEKSRYLNPDIKLAKPVNGWVSLMVGPDTIISNISYINPFLLEDLLVFMRDVAAENLAHINLDCEGDGMAHLFHTETGDLFVIAPENSMPQLCAREYLFLNPSDAADAAHALADSIEENIEAWRTWAEYDDQDEENPIMTPEEVIRALRDI